MRVEELQMHAQKELHFVNLRLNTAITLEFHV